jgi:CRAL/TRIO domain
MFVMGWNALKTLMDPLVAQKVSLHGENTCDEMKELIPQDQLLETYGGTAKMPEHSWPPHVPNTKPKFRERSESPNMMGLETSCTDTEDFEEFVIVNRPRLLVFRNKKLLLK